MIDRMLWSQPWFYTLGLTLLHSLWQGALIAALLALALGIWRRHPARQRYGFSVAAITLWFAASVVTFALLFDGHSAERIALAGSTLRVDLDLFSSLNAKSIDPAAIVPHFLLFWLAGVSLMSLRTAVGLYGVYSLKHRELVSLSDEWRQRINVWLKDWGVHRLLPVYLSARVQAPVVAGFFRQFLLLPLSFLTAFPPDQVRVILAHEVAHFLRRDALVNLLQTVFEILYFYHPAAWWISIQMRNEREYCCDDFAIARCGRPMPLARALVDLQKLQTPADASLPVLSAARRLQIRINRLFNNKENSMELRDKLLALLFVIGFMLVLVPLQGIGKNTSPAITGVEDNQTKKSKTVEVRIEKSGDEEKIFTVTASDTGDDKTEKTVVIKGDKSEEHRFKIKKDKTVMVTKDGKEIPIEELKEGMLDDLKELQRTEGKNKIFTITSSDEDSTRKHIVVKIMDADDDSATWHVKEDQEKIITIDSEGDTVKKKILIKINEGDDIFCSAGKDSLKRKVKIIHEHGQPMAKSEKHNTIGHEIKTQLAKDGFLAKKAATEFRITEKELTINGVKQPDEVFQKYRQLLSTSMGIEKDEKLEIKLKFKPENRD